MTPTQRPYQNIRRALDDKAVGEAVQPDGATLLVEVHLLFRQEMAYPAAGAQPAKRADRQTDRQDAL